jgi:hypothetical protein
LKSDSASVNGRGDGSVNAPVDFGLAPSVASEKHVKSAGRVDFGTEILCFTDKPIPIAVRRPAIGFLPEFFRPRGESPVDKIMRGLGTEDEKV